MLDGTSPWSTLIMIALMLGAFYLLAVRPAARKTREQQSMVGSLSAGDRVMTTAGVFATIRHLGATQAVVEIAPGVDMTITKQAILKLVKPSEEEFEYDDDPAEADALAGDVGPVEDGTDAARDDRGLAG